MSKTQKPVSIAKLNSPYLFSFTNRIEAIIFDFDGTLVDSRDIKAQAFGELYQSYGETVVEQVIAYHLENEGVSRFAKFQYWQETLLREKYTEETGDELSNRYSMLVVDAVIQAPLLPGVYEFLEEYHERILLFVASGTPEAELREIVNQRQMRHYFSGVYGSTALKVEIIRNVLNGTCFSPEHVLMVGDSLADLEGAKLAGTNFVGIVNGEKTPFPETVITIHHFNQLKKHYNMYFA